MNLCERVVNKELYLARDLLVFTRHVCGFHAFFARFLGQTVLTEGQSSQFLATSEAVGIGND